MRQKVTLLEKANRSHVDNEELQVQVSFIDVNFTYTHVCAKL